MPDRLPGGYRRAGIGAALVRVGGIAVVLVAVVVAAAARGAGVAELRLNDIQVLGSHNSYKRAMAPERMEALRAVSPAAAWSLDYAHAPIGEQLDLGLRKLEIDVFYDPGGALFHRQRVGGGGKSDFAVLHVQNLDDRSHCDNLVLCLAILDRWSRRHPRHLPVFVSFNAKDEVIDQPGFMHPRPFDETAWQVLDRELESVLAGRIITPADVVGTSGPVWPTLAQARGRFLFVLDEGGAKRAQYAGRWRERVMFANLPRGANGAAIMIVNDPLADFDRIQALVRDGFIVRTRADADTGEARSGSVERRDAAFASGAQLVSTDYYRPDERFGTGYRVTLPGGGAARCNPVRVAEPCVLDSVPPTPPR